SAGPAHRAGRGRAAGLRGRGLTFAARPTLARVRALEPFSPADATAVAGWVTSLEEASRWASMTSLPEAATFERWHADPDVFPFVGREAGVLVAYGEIWEDREEEEAELARLLVAPGARGRGLGRWLAR